MRPPPVRFGLLALAVADVDYDAVVGWRVLVCPQDGVLALSGGDFPACLALERLVGAVLAPGLPCGYVVAADICYFLLSFSCPPPESLSSKSKLIPTYHARARRATNDGGGCRDSARATRRNAYKATAKIKAHAQETHAHARRNISALRVSIMDPE